MRGFPSARSPLPAVLAAAMTAALAGAPPPAALHDDFESAAVGAVPDGWFVPPVVRQAGARAAVIDGDAGRCVEVVKEGPQQFGNLMRTIDAAPYRGMTVRFAASVRTEMDAPQTGARLWLRVDCPGAAPGFFDNMADRPITANEWREYEIVGVVADDAVAIAMGMMVFGPSTAWIDDVTFESLGAAGAGLEAARALDDRGLANLVALGRLVGYLRHFHPSDEAFEADWNEHVIAAVRAVEPAADATDLAGRLAAVAAALAPAAAVWPSGGEPPPRAPRPGAGDARLYWSHRGLRPASDGDAPQASIYWSRRDTVAAGADGGAAAAPGAAIEADLGAGVLCRVPLCVAVRDGATWPGAGLELDADSPPGWHESAGDRATRLAAVILAWNFLAHSYPYFDVVGTDWNAVLPEALRRAAVDAGQADFGRTLEWLVAQLHDGHGRVVGPGLTPSPYRVPFLLDWIEGRLVVTAVAGGIDVRPGDAVVTLDGRTPEALYAEHASLISGATEQWIRWRSLDRIAARSSDERFRAEMERPDGTRYTAFAAPVPAAPPAEPRPGAIAEVRPGIWYVDLDRVEEAQFGEALGDLAGAAGIVFDLRGYPSRISTSPIAHLIDEPVRCAQWHIPRERQPHMEDVTFDVSGWQVTPQPPRLTKRVAFIIDGRAISYAETYMGIIEHYGLAEIVGGPTAGTNGNVNWFTVPGGYRIMYTGMKVLKHDGAQHHGVGIAPTVPAARTIAGVAAGRDELLERAIEVVTPE